MPMNPDIIFILLYFQKKVYRQSETARLSPQKGKGGRFVCFEKMKRAADIPGPGQAKNKGKEKGTQKAEKAHADGFLRAGGKSTLPWASSKPKA